jgi:hypothetical protein
MLSADTPVGPSRQRAVWEAIDNALMEPETLSPADVLMLARNWAALPKKGPFLSIPAEDLQALCTLIGEHARRPSVTPAQVCDLVDAVAALSADGGQCPQTTPER